MTTVFQPPPTWELPMVLDFDKKTGVFSPVWLNWFLALIRHFQADGTLPVVLPVIEVQAVTTGFSITPAAATDILILTAGGTLAAGTIIMSAAPVTGQVLTVVSNQIIQALTVTANVGQVVYNAPTRLNLSRNTPGVITGFSFSCVYVSNGSAWYRLS